MQECFACKTDKPLSQFYAHYQMADDHLNKCKDCVKESARIRYEKRIKDPLWREKELARHREKSRAQRIEGRASPSKEITRKASYARNRHKYAATTLVARAILRGLIARMPCQVCGAERVHAHHEDYDRPLDVMWLCSQHHAERHIQLRQQREYQAAANISNR